MNLIMYAYRCLSISEINDSNETKGRKEGLEIFC